MKSDSTHNRPYRRYGTKLIVVSSSMRNFTVRLGLIPSTDNSAATGSFVRLLVTCQVCKTGVSVMGPPSNHGLRSTTNCACVTVPMHRPKASNKIGPALCGRSCCGMDSSVKKRSFASYKLRRKARKAKCMGWP